MLGALTLPPHCSAGVVRKQGRDADENALQTGLASEDLPPGQTGEQTVPSHQVFVRTLLRHAPPLVEHVDDVGSLDRAEAMGDYDAGLKDRTWVQLAALQDDAELTARRTECVLM